MGNLIYIKHLIQALEDPENTNEDKVCMLKLAVKMGTLTANEAIELVCNYWFDAEAENVLRENEVL